MLAKGIVQRVSNLSHKKILVTGAAGYIGAHLCRSLLGMGGDVVGVSRKSRKDNKTCNLWMKANLRDSEAVQNLLRTVKPDIIYHLASHVSGSRDIDSIYPTFHDNLTSTVNLLTEATKSGCEKIVLIGSMEEPEYKAGTVIPSSPYAAAKHAASAYGRLFHALYRTPVVIARVFMVYGPGQHDLTKLVPFVITSLLKKKIPALTSGTRLVDWIYVRDVVDALVRMAQTENIDGETIDVGTGKAHSVRSIASKIAEIVDPSVELGFGSLSERPMEQERVADTKKALAKIAWSAKIDLTRGLQETVDWYRGEIERLVDKSSSD